jgi:tetratricopeptide (TPR) repeat protein
MNAALVLSGLLCVAVLSGCTTNPPAALKSTANLANAMSDAEKALKAGQNDKALAMLQGVARDYPAEKTPWLRIAQLRYDSSNYGEAIVSATQVLERDPDDMLANSIVAVSGLRVASKALADLSHKNNLTGTVRSEAQDLAKLLRASLGEEVLVPVRDRSARSVPTRKIPLVAPATPSKPGNAKPAPADDDPFSNVK